MQNKKQLEKLSRLRVELRRLLRDLEDSLEVVFGREVLIKGNVYEQARKCGKPSCGCARGRLHRSMVLSWSHQGKTRLWTVPAERLSEVRRKSREYLRFRDARARVTKTCRQLVVLLDGIETLRRQEP